jgi:hypothetical protein
VECFNYLGNVITNDTRYTREIKSRTAMAKGAFNTMKNLFASKLDLKLCKKIVKCYIRCKTLYDAETWTLRKVDQKCLKSFEMWCWRRMEQISWTDHERNEVLYRVKDKNILHTMKRRKGNWICHILRRNWLLKHVIEGRIVGIEVTRRGERRHKQLLDDLTEKREYWKLKEDSRSRYVEHSLCSRLQTCRKTKYGMMMQALCCRKNSCR